MNRPVAGTHFEQLVLRERVASVYSTYTASVLAHICFVLLLGAVMYTQLHHPRVVLWVGMLLLFDAWTLFTPRWHPAVPASDSLYWARKIARILTFVGLIAAAGPWLFFPFHNTTVTSLLMVLAAGSCARVAQSCWALKPALLGYCVPVMTSMIAALAWQGPNLPLLLGTIGTIYLLLMMRVGLQEHKLLSDALALRFENEALTAKLDEQVTVIERASAEKTRFLASASHDLRQPLHAIALFGAALENELRDRPESENAERLMRAVHALGVSLDAMLDISRLDAAVITPEPQPVQLDELFLSLNLLFSAQAEQKALELRMRASGLWVRSDPQLLIRMLSNLIDNALKYTPKGRVTVTARARGEAVWIDVRDTGIGIEPEQLERIFGEFYQVGNAGRDRAQGLGLGLSIVQRLSRLLDHPVQVRSRHGRGACFRLVLPAIAAASGSPGDFAPLSNAGSPERPRAAVPALSGRILLIDDDAEIRSAMTALMRSCAMEVQAVADESEAARALQQAGEQGQPFVLLICDYRLSEGADGLEVGLRLRQRFNIDIPLLLVTGETSPERLQRVRAAAVPVLFKPVDATTLLQTVTELTAARATPAVS
ncbi:hybrid sensor histidine kinase/response regulator [Variovorax sp. DXTD-1]|uniref:ATP-binding response regulator n=1 Tax=Variovorax sp. DXTD-1 TaxID=2495592 RepID=UPI000F86F3D5|nr:hybrid sensor histidine kinase/response regulator [Variovorax sp. DXTD-1]RST46314.1 hybrid sensor histidine kinase/response regulator [Variovorax sp. DXTD-1]